MAIDDEWGIDGQIIRNPPANSMFREMLGFQRRRPSLRTIWPVMYLIFRPFLELRTGQLDAPRIGF